MKYLKIEDPSKFYYFDVEGDGLQPTRIWCLVALNKATRQVWRFINDGSASVYHEIKKFFDERKDVVWCAHNGTSYDFPNIEKLCGVEVPYDRLCDSLVLSYLYNPQLEGGHSLEEYGERLHYPKVAHEDWSQFSPEMLHRCEQDVFLLEKVHDALLVRMNRIGFSELSCQIEHKIRRIIDKQQENGFWFDKEEALKLHKFLRDREYELEDSVRKLFPPILKSQGTYARRLKKDGSEYSSYLRHLQEADAVQDNDDGTYDVLKYEEFNLGSPKQRLERLLGLGYEPTQKTKKGNPRIDEDSLLAYAKECGRPEITAMADWLVHNGRANMIETWLKFVGPDSRIHGRVFSCGAASRRMTHNSPNCANIPSAAKAKYGHECRALWGVEPGRGLRLVGYDASGLETVGLLHYLNNPVAAKLLTQPKPNDVHTMNARALTEALGRPVDREWGSKTSWYAWLYGAYPPKLGEIVKGPPSDGEVVINTFFKNVPGLKKLINETQEEWKQNKGLLRCIDGGFVWCRNQGAALNYRIQPLGAIVMKVTSILLEEESIKEGVEFKKVGDIHDEGQTEVKEAEAEKLGQMAVSCITNAGEFLGVREKLTGEYKIGDNWSQTH